MERVAAGSLHPNPALSGALPWMKVSILRVESEVAADQWREAEPEAGQKPEAGAPRARFSLRRLRALAVVCG